MATLIQDELSAKDLTDAYKVELVLTKMADSTSSLESNADVARYVDALVADSTVRAVVFNVALADFEEHIGEVVSGKYAERLRTSEGCQSLVLTPSDKLIGRIRKERKDIFVVGFKTTTQYASNAQYVRALELLKTNSLNLVLANDTVTRDNMIVAPEETQYCETTDRKAVLEALARITVSRMQNHFTRSTVVPGEAVAWQSDVVPENLSAVVDHCIAQGAYKPLLGKTAGHFAVKADEGEILTSIRKSNFNQLSATGLVRVESKKRR